MSESIQSARIGAPDLQTLGPNEKAIVEAAIAKLGGPFGPRMPLLNSPEVAGAWSRLGKALADSSLKKVFRELAILVVGQHWQADFEWHAHAPRAIAAGLTAEQIEAIRRAEVPHFDDLELVQVHAYCSELVKSKGVSDATYTAARSLLGDRVLVDLTVLLGHFTNVAMTLNAHRVPLPPGTESPFGGDPQQHAAPQAVKTGWIEREGVASRYSLRPGSGPMVVFVHELGGTLESWDACIGFLPSHICTLSLELRGSGLSSKVRRPTAFDDLVDDVHHVIQSLETDRPVVLVGVAAGAALVIRLAARRSLNVVGVVAAVPALGTPVEQRSSALQVADRIEREGMETIMEMARTYPNHLREQHPDRWSSFRMKYLGNDPTSYAHLLRTVIGIDLSDDVKALNRPTLVIGGSWDIRPVEMMRNFARQLPEGRFEEVAAGHFMPSQAPDLLAGAIQRFLDSLLHAEKGGM